jgi:hypothetical protein
MPTKVKRGLGLLLVALIALAIGNALIAVGAPGLIVLVPAAAAVACGAIGLGLLVWGLLRD